MDPLRNENFAEDEALFVITRTGKRELLDPIKIARRLQTLMNRPPKIHHVNSFELMKEVTKGLCSNITTSQIDEYTAAAAASLTLSNPYYMKLASRLIVDNHQKNTDRSFTDKMRKLYFHRGHNDVHTPLVSSEFYNYVEEHQDFLEPIIDYSRDFLMDYFGFKTFENVYGMKINDKVIDRPQDLYMRKAVGIHMNTCDTIEEELNRIKTTYDHLSLKRMTHATPTCFGAGTPSSQLLSCFLLGVEDSIYGIMKAASDMALISKEAGGIGFHYHSIRSRGAPIRGGQGKSKGIVPFLRIYDSIMTAVDQGGRRPGSAAVYLMPHHPDIMEFLQLKLNAGIDKERARDLFYGVALPDIFMNRVKEDGEWSLFDPHTTEDLSNYADDRNATDLGPISYTKKYIEMEKKYTKVPRIKARAIFQALYTANEEKGVPYVIFWDAIHTYNMQINLGICKSSNLCTEITIYSDHKEYGCCNLASLSYAACVVDRWSEEELAIPIEDRRPLNHEFPLNPYFDYKLLQDLTVTAVINLNNVIDKNKYPVPETKHSNFRHRPIGIGFQGLADAYIKMRYPFESDNARKLNKYIAETVMYAALSQSTKLSRECYMKWVKKCKEEGEVLIPTYNQHDYDDHLARYTDPKEIPTTIGSYPSMLWKSKHGHEAPISKGIFHWELCGLKPENLSGMYDWDSLREHIKKFGVRNSLLVACMPTASTSQLLGNNECFEPYTTNIYKRNTKAGEFIVINKYLIHDLFRLGIWNDNIKDYLLLLKGSIQSIEGIPDELKQLYKTAYEISQSELIRQAADRQPFVDQAQSLNLYVTKLTYGTFNSLIFQGWKQGLKTGKYYLHSEAAADPQRFTIDPDKQREMEAVLAKEKSSRNLSFMEPKGIECLMCGS